MKSKVINSNLGEVNYVEKNFKNVRDYQCDDNYCVWDALLYWYYTRSRTCSCFIANSDFDYNIVKNVKCNCVIN